MTIDKAIECERNHRLLPEYHEQLAEWLEELKEYKQKPEGWMWDEAERNGYNKAIDDLMEKASECFISDADWNYLVQVAEQLKAGDAK